MTDALLTADQHISEGYFAPKSAHQQGIASQTSVALGDWGRNSLPGSSGSIQARRTLQGCDLIQNYESEWLGILKSSVDEKGTTIDVQLGRAKNALEHLFGSKETAQPLRQFQAELQWLNDNRHKFVGQWIALQGGQLLAVGATAKEVFSKVAGQATPPLVIRIDDDELPFAGW
jgi:hypothetical protein